MTRTPSLRSLERIASEALDEHRKRVLENSALGAEGILSLHRGTGEGDQREYSRSYRSREPGGMMPSYSPPKPRRNVLPDEKVQKLKSAVEFLVNVLANSAYIHVMQAASLGGLYSEPIILAEEEGKYELRIDPPIRISTTDMRGKVYDAPVGLGGLALIVHTLDGGVPRESSTYITPLLLCSGEDRAMELGKLVIGVEGLLSHYPGARVSVARMKANLAEGLGSYAAALAKGSAGR
ncbi:hypothetical protein HYV82_03705 [Candidatus Woesearchaeota archaeon]|nr:hypothetical protein [Candidatus Woesearchaeota archaeon]